MASFQGQVKIVKMFLSNSASVNDNYRDTAISLSFREKIKYILLKSPITKASWSSAVKSSLYWSDLYQYMDREDFYTADNEEGYNIT